MTKIIKMPHWNHYCEPAKPRPPTEPKKSFSKSLDVGSGSEILALKDLKLPEGFTLNDVQISTNYDSYMLYAYVIKDFPNENYDNEFIKYNKDLVKFDEDMKKYDEEIIEYRAWKKEYDAELLKTQIKEARNFLKKHDKKIK